MRDPVDRHSPRLAKSKQVDVILLDFEKAFDKVPHGRLLYKLDYYGVRNKTNRWIRSFLVQRKQKVLLEGTHSSEAEVLSGIPQCTVLCPLLFLAFINDLPGACKSSDAQLFADDSLLFKIVDSIQDSILLQQDLDALEVWEKTWQMSFNATKCSVMHIMPSNKKCLIQTTYHIHGHNLEMEDASKYLGVTLDKN